MEAKKMKTDFSDYPQINTQDLYQVDYWTQRWNITFDQLIRTAKAVDSTIVSDMERHLKSKPAASNSRM